MIDAGLLIRTNSAATVAAEHADAVDTQARFPTEAIAAFRQQGLLGILVPVDFGGPGASLAETGQVCRILGRACGSSALIFAMHQIQVACLVAAASESTWQREFLQRVACDELLLGSVTSEVGVGGNIRKSLCALDRHRERVSLTKHSSAISYGEHADALLITARRDQSASGSDQVMIVAERRDTVLTTTGRWDTLGMRGTSSKAFDVTIDVDASQIAPVPFGDIARDTMLPISHILWGGVWLGIAIDAAEKARSFLRRQAQNSPGVLPRGAPRFEKLASLLATMHARLDTVTADYASACPNNREELSLGLLTEVNALKVTLSELALNVVQEAMMICGIAGYQYGTPYSIGRHLRDLHSAPLMVNNDFIVANTATLLVAQRASLMRG